MPWVHIDDLFFVGAGIDLERTGHLVNHTINPWLSGFGTEKFYVHLPFASYSLAAWIRLFGASTASFIVFAWLWYGIGGFGLAHLFGRFGLPLGARLLLVLMYLTLLIQTGFRPEAQAFGLMFLGLSLLDGAAPFWRKLAALLLLGFSFLTYPLTLGLAAPFSVAVLWSQRAAGTTARAWLRETVRVWLLPLGLAVAAVVMSFLAMIHFEIALFWSIFDAHRRSRAFSEGALAGYFRLITEYRQAPLMLPPFLLLVACVLFAAVRRRQVEPALRALTGGCAVAAICCIFLYAARAPEWVMLLAFCAGCALASGQSFRRRRWLIVMALAGLYAWTQCLWMVHAGLRRFPDPATLRAARDAALRSGKELVVDSSTTRYVFDYHLPERARQLVFSKPWMSELPITLADKKGEDFWIVTAPTLDFFGSDLPDSYHNYPRIRLGSHEFKSLALCPDDPLILP